MPKETRKALSLPRPLVNKILAHAQQSTESNSAYVSCGLIGTDTNDKKFYYPISESIDTAIFFSNPHTPFQQTLEHIKDKQQTVFAYVFTAPHLSEGFNTESPDKNFFAINQHYYIMNSLDTKGVLSMQGFYRNENDLQKVELTLEV